MKEWRSGFAKKSQKLGGNLKNQEEKHRNNLLECSRIEQFRR